MRNTLPALSIPLSASSRPTQPSPATLETHQRIPTVRLTNLTPSAVDSRDAGTSAIYNTFDLPSTSSPLAPRPLTTSDASRKRLVPKKSKLGLLGAVKGNKERTQNDFSDVVRRIGGTTSAGRDGYEIYVDHTEDPEFEEIVLVKKKKSRLGLNAVAWGPGEENLANVLKPKPSANALKPKASENALKPKSSANILKPKSKDKENSIKAKPVENLLKPKADENQKWWSISRGRKESKEQKGPRRSKCEYFSAFSHPRMKPRIPDLDHPLKPQSRRRKPCVQDLALLTPELCSRPPLLHPIPIHPILLERTLPRPCCPLHFISNPNIVLLPQLRGGPLPLPLVFLHRPWSERFLVPARLLFVR